VATGSKPGNRHLTAEEREACGPSRWRSAGKGVRARGDGNERYPVHDRAHRRAEALGVDGCMVVVPYYNKAHAGRALGPFSAPWPTRAAGPLMLYNVPGRTGCNLLPRTVEALAAHPRSWPSKEASGSVEQPPRSWRPPSSPCSPERTRSPCPRRRRAPGVVSRGRARGGADFVAMVEAGARGTDRGRRPPCTRRLAPLNRVLFLESIPPGQGGPGLDGMIREESASARPVESAPREALVRELERLGVAAPA